MVKVQRPGLKQLFDIDLKNVRVLAQWLQNVDPKSDGAARDWVAIYDECSRILYQVSCCVWAALYFSQASLWLLLRGVVFPSRSFLSAAAHCPVSCNLHGTLLGPKPDLRCLHGANTC